MTDIGMPAEPRILLVDDWSSLRPYDRSALDQAGFEVEPVWVRHACLLPGVTR